MFSLLVDLSLLALSIFVTLKVVREWKRIDLKERQHEIEEIEAQYKTIQEIEKHCPKYKEKKEYVAKFLGK